MSAHGRDDGAPMKVYDVTGAASELIAERFPDAEVGRRPDIYDVAVACGLDRVPAPAAVLRRAAAAVGRGGQVIVTGHLGGAEGGVRALRSLDVQALLQRHGRVDEVGVTDGDQFVATLTPCRRRGEIAVWTGYAIGPWHPTDVLERGLGGSETAAWRLSEQLARMGYVVTLYGQFEQEGMVGDVLLRDFRRFDPTRPLEALVGFRDATLFDRRPDARTTILWLEDLPGPERLSPDRAENIDRVACVSSWHRQALIDHYPWLDPGQLAACRNGIEHDYFTDPDGEPAPERERRVVYTSSPDRGLDVLLDLWPEIRARVPDATLVSTYSRWYDLVAGVYQEAADHRRKLGEQLDSLDGASRVAGGMGQRDLARLMRSSTVWAHPSFYTSGDMEFHETSCISSLEAQAAGCVVVASNWGALTESVRFGTLVDGDPREKEGVWRQAFVDAVVQGLTDDKVQRAAQVAGPDAVRDMDWRGAAEQLAAMFESAGKRKAA